MSLIVLDVDKKDVNEPTNGKCDFTGQLSIFALLDECLRKLYIVKRCTLEKIKIVQVKGSD